MTILFAIQDWGLGHATRSSAIITRLQERGHQLTLYSSGLALSYLQTQHPDLTWLDAPHIDFRYDGSPWSSRVRIAWQLYDQYRRDRQAFSALSGDYDYIISDARPGICGFRQNVRQTSVFINHQWNTSIYGLHGQILQTMTRALTRGYDHIWIPDTSDRLASGELSYLSDSRATYVGLLSSLEPLESSYDIDLLMVLSGPEPHRTELEEILIDLVTFSDTARKIVLVRGTQLTMSAAKSIPEQLEIIDFLGSGDLSALMSRSRHIVCRSGYSSIMDLMALGQHALLIPTPDQPEQEYLASYHERSKRFATSLQRELQKADILDLMQDSSVFDPLETSWLLDQALSEIGL